MRYVHGVDRQQTPLLPPAIDDYVGKDNPVRFIDVFVDGLDLYNLGFGRATPKRTGRPDYYPGDLLKLYIYGYLNRVRSSRELGIKSRGTISAWENSEAELPRTVQIALKALEGLPHVRNIAGFEKKR